MSASADVSLASLKTYENLFVPQHPSYVGGFELHIHLDIWIFSELVT